MSVDADVRTRAHVIVVFLLAEAKREIEHMQKALKSRGLIGQAQRILMARLDIDADTAFANLKRESMHRNRKLVDIAAEIAHTRQLP